MEKNPQTATAHDDQHPEILQGGMTIKTTARNQIPPVQMDIITGV